MILCDFCSGRPVTARYNADDFHADTISAYAAKTHIEFESVSVGDWAACAHCEALIDAKDWDTLLTRAVTEFFHHNPQNIGVVPEPLIKAHLKTMYDKLLTMNFRKGEL